jgi:hypothetical protein
LASLWIVGVPRADPLPWKPAVRAKRAEVVNYLLSPVFLKTQVGEPPGLSRRG